MNYKGLSFYLSLFCFPVSFLAFINILYSVYFDYYLSIDSYYITLFTSLSLGLGFLYYGKHSDKRINFIEQLILIILVYIIVGFLISIPFYLGNLEIFFISAFFDIHIWLNWHRFSSIKNIKYLDPHSFWRSSSQWFGGLFFFFLILIFSNKSFNYKMTNLTFSGDSNFKSEENIKNNLIRIFILYSVLSLIILFA